MRHGIPQLCSYVPTLTIYYCVQCNKMSPPPHSTAESRTNAIACRCDGDGGGGCGGWHHARCLPEADRERLAELAASTEQKNKNKEISFAWRCVQCRKKVEEDEEEEESEYEYLTDEED